MYNNNCQRKTINNPAKFVLGPVILKPTLKHWEFGVWLSMKSLLGKEFKTN